MSQLVIYPESGPETVLFTSDDSQAIAQQLVEVGITFRRWPERDLAGHAAAQVLHAYASEVDALMTEGGYQSVDVVAMWPDHPEREALRNKFLSEHTHQEDEVRFFVQGAGLFVLHIDDKVYALTCGAGDLINVPAGTKHWFDMGPLPEFVAIRLFTNPEGWVAQFTGEEIAKHFPKYA